MAVEGARALSSLINSLLSLPFEVKVATQDFHPKDHVSFASNHPPPNNKPFESSIEISNTAKGREQETKLHMLWPIHCVQGTPGASIIPEIDGSKLDIVVKKGMDAQVEMYSAFADAFGNRDHKVGVSVDLEDALHKHGITDVFVVGVAGDYCVKYTAIDASKAGFKSWVIEEGTECVDSGKGWEETKSDFAKSGVKLVRADGHQVGWVKVRV